MAQRPPPQRAPAPHSLPAKAPAHPAPRPPQDHQTAEHALLSFAHLTRTQHTSILRLVIEAINHSCNADHIPRVHLFAPCDCGSRLLFFYSASRPLSSRRSRTTPHLRPLVNLRSPRPQQPPSPAPS